MSETSGNSPIQTNNEIPPWRDPKNMVPAQPAPRKHKRIHIDLDDDYGDYAVLQCPVCGYDFSQLSGVEVRGGIGRLGGLGTRVDQTGTRMFETDVHRGVAVDLEFSGECGHDYVYTFEFYKGQIHVIQRERPGTHQDAIWRD